MKRPSLTNYAWLSIVVAVATIAMKGLAYWLTGSVGLLSDALDSLANLAAAVVALVVLTIVAHPPDKEHAYGHDKAEYFSSGLEGGLILLAALGIAAAAVERMVHPRPIENLGIGLGVSIASSIVDLWAARILISAGRRYRSITLEADAQHLMTDVWTSAGVIVGVGAAGLTGWTLLDPLVALLVAANILWTGFRLLRRSVAGMMDTALPGEEREKVVNILEQYRKDGIRYHALRTRRASARSFVSVHILVPGSWTVQRGHELLESIERQIREQLTGVTVLSHLEPIEDETAWKDTKLDRDD